MDIFDEVDMESSRTDDQLGERIPPSRIQDASTGLRYPKVIRSHEDEVPHGADCGESRSCLEPRLSFCKNSYVLKRLFAAGAAFAHAARMSDFAEIDEKRTFASKVQESFGSSRRCAF